MKKFLVVVFACAMVSVFGVGLYNTTTTQIDNLLTTYRTNGDAFHIYVAYSLKALSSINASTMTYDTFKTTVNTACQNAQTTEKLTKTYENVVPNIVAGSKTYAKFAADVIKDNDYKNMPIVKRSKVYFQYMTKDQLRSNLVSLVIGKNYKVANDAFQSYVQNIGSFSNDEIKSDLKQMKKYVYPKISKDDNWKALAVKIELQLKAIE